MASEPNISVNKLAEFIVSRSARQRSILTDRKYPDPDFKMGIYHREAAEAVSQYLTAGAIDPEPLTRQLRLLEQSTPEKVGAVRRVSSNIDAIERFSEMLDDVDLQGADPSLGSNRAEKLRYHNVAISVRPEIILRGDGPKGKRLVGGIKLHFSKTRPHTTESAGYVSAVLQEHCKVNVATEDKIVYAPYCFVIDVGSGKVFPGVKATSNRMKDVAAACQNISILWQGI